MISSTAVYHFKFIVLGGKATHYNFAVCQCRTQYTNTQQKNVRSCISKFLKQLLNNVF